VSAETKEEFKKLYCKLYRLKSETNLPRNSNPPYLPVFRKQVFLETRRDSENLETFMEGLNEFFRSGPHMIEQSILKELHANLGLKHKSREVYGFVD
jgi:hypothetical protein